jgi:electron transport complex protein RnfE
LLGAIRELTGRGTLLSGADMLFGEWGQYMALTIIPEHPGFLLAMLPPGAFFCLALLIAGRNAWEARETLNPSRATKLIPDSHEA